MNKKIVKDICCKVTSFFKDSKSDNVLLKAKVSAPFSTSCFAKSLPIPNNHNKNSSLSH